MAEFCGIVARFVYGMNIVFVTRNELFVIKLNFSVVSVVISRRARPFIHAVFKIVSEISTDFFLVGSKIKSFKLVVGSQPQVNEMSMN